MDQFIEQANKFHPTIKFTAEISENEITFLDTVVFKGERLKNEFILDIKTHYKPTETFQYTHFNSCHPPGVKNGFIKGEAMRLLRTNSSKTTFEESLVKFKQRLRSRGYPKTVIERSLSGVNFAAGPSALTQKKKANERILPFVTRYHSAVNNLKQALMEQWRLIQNQPLLKTIYLKPPIISYKRRVRAGLSLTYSHTLSSTLKKANCLIKNFGLRSCSFCVKVLKYCLGSIHKFSQKFGKRNFYVKLLFPLCHHLLFYTFHSLHIKFKIESIFVVLD